MAIQLKRGSGAPGSLSEGEPAVDLTNGVIYVGASGGTVVKALMAAKNLSDVASASTCRTNLGLAIGTDVQAYDADLAAIAALSGTSTIYYRSGAATWSAVTIGASLSFSAGTLNTIQDIRTTAYPQWARIVLNDSANFTSLTFLSSTATTNGTYLGLDGADNLDINQRESAKSISIKHNSTIRIQVNSTGLGFFGATPVAQASDTAASTDLASVITLANAMRTILKNLGFMA